MKIKNGQTDNGFPHKIKAVVQFSDLPPLDTFAELLGINQENFNKVEYMLTLPASKVAGHCIQEIFLDSLPYNAYVSLMIRAANDRNSGGAVVKP